LVRESGFKGGRERLRLIYGPEPAVKGGTDGPGKISEIKAKLAHGPAALTQADIDWLIKRVEELVKENGWLRKELAYAEYQGDVSF
jgi:hypothetical protein